MKEPRNWVEMAMFTLRLNLAIALYLFALAGAWLLSSAVMEEYFVGGWEYLKPIAAFAIPLAVIVADIEFQVRRRKGRWFTLVTLILLPFVWVGLAFLHHVMWVVPQRVEDCGTYESNCDDYRESLRKSDVKF